MKEADSCHIVVNGEARTVSSGSALPDLLGALGLDPLRARGIAVAVNDEVVRRKQWDAVRLREGDRVEIVTANQGG
jgi:sulfur carrier protein